MESDARYYRRRACEELSAADRAVTVAARRRRLQLVDLYLDKLREMDEPSPFNERELKRRMAVGRPVMAWGLALESQLD
ncbi:MAG TPA: hypothetical protein VFK50_00530 [Sphingomicrobium sp.]|nr:hypothetical protein [Sphingomicrobium sp.]